MAGVKGKSGGKRKGAGRPIENFTLKRSKKYGFVFPPLKQGKVVDIDRKILTIEFDDGTRLIIIRSP